MWVVVVGVNAGTGCCRQRRVLRGLLPRYCIFALRMGGGVAPPDALFPCVLCCAHALACCTHTLSCVCVLPPPPLSSATITLVWL